MKKRYFKASWSTTLRLLTLVFAGLLLLLPAGLLWRTQPVTMGDAIAGVAIPWSILATSAAFSVRGYSIAGRDLIIHHFAFTRRYPLAELEQATIDPAATQLSIRTFGIGGLGGYIGWFRNQQLGNYLAFVTNSANQVVLRFRSRTVVISPDNPGAFMAEIEARS